MTQKPIRSLDVVIRAQRLGHTQELVNGMRVGDLLRTKSVTNVATPICKRRGVVMPKEIDINAIGQAIDTTWGRCSTPQTASYSVKFTLLGGNRILASYTVITNFVSEKEMILMKRSCAEESEKVIDAHVKSVKDTYKGITNESLKFSAISSSDSLEIIGFNVHNPKRTAYYRRKTVFEIA